MQQRPISRTPKPSCVTPPRPTTRSKIKTMSACAQSHLALEQATIAYEGAKARLADLQNGATPATIAAARAGVSQAAGAAGHRQEVRAHGPCLRPSGCRPGTGAVGSRQSRRPPRSDRNCRGQRRRRHCVAPECLGCVSRIRSCARHLVGLIATINTAIGEQVSPGTPVDHTWPTPRPGKLRPLT